MGNHGENSKLRDVAEPAVPLNGPSGPAAPLTGKRPVTLQSERVRFLFSNLPVSLVISALLALVLVVVQASVISTGWLLGWSALLGAVLLSRGALYILWKRSKCATCGVDTCHWLFWFRVGVIATGIVLGLGGVLLMPSGAPAHRAYVAFALAGLSASAATTLATDGISTTCFLFTVLVPQIVFLAGEGDAISLGMSTMDFLFLIFLLGSARQSRFQLEENFVLHLKAVENESRLSRMLESSPIATRISDAATKRVVFANSSYITLIDSTPEQVIGVVPNSYYAHAEVYDEVVKKILAGESITDMLVELRFPGEDPWTKWVLASYFPIEYHDRPAVLGWFYDITDRKLAEDQIAHMAYHDALTGLPNRSLFFDRLRQAIAKVGREHSVLALMFVDLDKFKPVNDKYGHNIGDLLLKAVAERILGCVRETDSAARIGGDEFVVLLPSVKSAENAMEIAQKIRHALNMPFEIEGLSLDISSSTGVALYPDHADSEQKLIMRADIAMYHAKAEGRDCVKLYQADM